MTRLRAIDILIEELVNHFEDKPETEMLEDCNLVDDSHLVAVDELQIVKPTANDPSDSAATPNTRIKRRSFTITRKLETIEIFEKVQSYVVASALTDVPSTLIRRWVKEKAYLDKYTTSPFLKRRPKQFRDLDDQFEFMLIDLVYFRKCLHGPMSQLQLLRHADTLRHLMGYKEQVTISWLRAVIKKRNINLKN